MKEILKSHDFEPLNASKEDDYQNNSEEELEEWRLESKTREFEKYFKKFMIMNSLRQTKIR